MGVDLRKVVPACTMLGEWVLNGNLKVPLNLEDSCTRWGLEGKRSLVSELIASGVCPSEIPPHLLKDYCLVDVLRCEQLFLRQRERLRLRKQLHIWHVRNLTANVLADISFHGMKLDAERVNERYERALEERRLAEEELGALTQGVNLASPKQVGELLYGTLGFTVKETTATGKPKADDGTISKLVPTTKDQEVFIRCYKQFKNADSLLSKNLKFFKLVCDQNDGIFSASLNQGRTATHRLASSGNPILFDGESKAAGVQFQNLPREFKGLFKARREGWNIIESDAAQLEFRVAADLCGESLAAREISDGVDIHSNTVAAYDNKISRQEAKPLTFKPLFGGRGSNPADKKYCAFFRKKYKDIDREQNSWVRQVIANKGELTTKYGMKYFWRNASINSWGRCSDENSIFNYPIQGFATGEIVPIALICLWYRMDGMESYIVNTIHDSIISEVHPDEEERYKYHVLRAFTLDVYKYLETCYNYSFKVELGCGIKVATHWGDTKIEDMYSVRRDGTARHEEKFNKIKEEIDLNDE